MNNQATPRPWTIKSYKLNHINFTCIESGNQRICKIKHYPHYGDVEANAKLIVKAVNCHDKLLSALKIAYSMMSNYITDDPSDKYLKRLDYIKQALQKAGEL